MNMLLNVLLTMQILSALTMVGLILIQHGKGADMGAAFGSGSSGSLFGASGSANFLSRSTAVLAATFFACTLALAYFGNAQPVSTGSVLENSAVVAPPTSAIPAADTSATDSVPAPAAPVAPASDSSQIPTK